MRDARLILNSYSRELLQCRNCLWLRKKSQIRVFTRGHRDIRTPGTRVDFDIAVKVGNIEQFLDVVSRDVALFFELRCRAV